VLLWVAHQDEVGLAVAGRLDDVEGDVAAGVALDGVVGVDVLGGQQFLNAGDAGAGGLGDRLVWRLFGYLCRTCLAPMNFATIS
jgi:hypothetical protein